MVVSSGPCEFGCKKVTLVNRSVEKAQEVLEDDMVSRTAIWNLGFRNWAVESCCIEKNIVGFGYGSFMYFWRL